MTGLQTALAVLLNAIVFAIILQYVGQRWHYLLGIISGISITLIVG